MLSTRVLRPWAIAISPAGRVINGCPIPANMAPIPTTAGTTFSRTLCVDMPTFNDVDDDDAAAVAPWCEMVSCSVVVVVVVVVSEKTMAWHLFSTRLHNSKDGLDGVADKSER